MKKCAKNLDQKNQVCFYHIWMSHLSMDFVLCIQFCHFFKNDSNFFRITASSISENPKQLEFGQDYSIYYLLIILCLFLYSTSSDESVVRYCCDSQIEVFLYSTCQYEYNLHRNTLLITLSTTEASAYTYETRINRKLENFYCVKLNWIRLTSLLP